MPTILIRMCGIAGELNFKRSVPETVLAEMLPMLARRGPDHEGQWQEGAIALGHRRLNIIDLHPRANQPLWDPDSNCRLVFNGCIYNYQELRAQLRNLGHRFYTKSDSEVILKAYAEWGEGCERFLEGMFAFAIWDAPQQQLFLVRDRLGIKPLYYTHTQGHFRFASNTQALLAAGDVDKDLDAVALHHHLSLHGSVPAPYTLLRGVRKLEPGHTLTVSRDGAVRKRRFWNLEAVNPDPARSEEEWLEITRVRLREAVHCRLKTADVPVGVLLSGGLDSSLLVALLAEAGVSRVRTYSVGFEGAGGEAGDEFEYSDAVVAHYDTDHHKYFVNNEVLCERLDEMLTCMSEPMVAQDAIAFYLLSEQVRQDVSVVLSGQGADEAFAGYFWYPRMHTERADGLDAFCRHYLDRTHRELGTVLEPGWVGADHTRELLEKRLQDNESVEFLNAVLRMDLTMLITDDPVKRVDNMTMAWGLEARVPYLDAALLQAIAGMPPELKLREGGKYPLRALARGRLPDAVIDRPKGYFPVPALKHVSGSFYDWAKTVLVSEKSRNQGLFREEYVKGLLQNPDQRSRIDGNFLWHAAALERWLQLNVS